MSRVKRGVVTKRRHKKIMKLAKGYRNIRHSSFRRAKETIMKAGMHAFADRRKKKRVFRSLWILRINAAVREHGLSYSVFMNKLMEKGITLNRKTLSEMAVTQPETFAKIVESVK
ncbi:MAG: 50S ribosomal protein L20 [Candidatus Gracilibacteria bacterium]